MISPLPTESKTPSISAVQELLTRSIKSEKNPVSTTHRHLALQIAHNLRYQHGWADLHIHVIPPTAVRQSTIHLLSGLPPDRLYVHPDEQIALLQQQKSEGKTGMPQLDPEREWVLPSHLREKWTLRRFGDAFDAVSLVPDLSEGVPVPFDDAAINAGRGQPVNTDKTNPWRTTKRVLLATVDDDSTIVYYIVHDGVVKPRQN